LDNDKVVLAGHGRLLAATKLQLKEVPCVEIGHLSKPQRKAYILADNKLALNAGWDNKKLDQELKDLKNADYDTRLTGFQDKEIAGILDTIDGDGEYKISKKKVGIRQDEYRQISFNNSGDLHKPQDVEKVRSVPYKVEGTIISGIFKLNKEYLSKVISS